ncbi:permease [Clostridium sp. UBA4548]|uniref:permease n=1 Tax=Clostridium sp. UBA4548 TaxID=1946361 RepID=UPI0025C1946D|nr:permease [Clostridium sp. UBA4548]
MTTYMLYGIVIILYLISFLKNRDKTKQALIKSAKSFESIMPQFLSVIFIVGFILTALSPETISKLLGDKSGVVGVFIASIIGSITIMPTFVAFPTAELLLENGAGYTQVTALISTLMFVGVITFPMEAKFIGKRAALIRNLIYFLYSILVAFVIGRLMR